MASASEVVRLPVAGMTCDHCVGTVKSANASWTVGDGSTGPITSQLRAALLDIQTGTAPDTHGWMHRLV